MPVTKVKSRWDSGNLIFHESSSLATIADILTIGTTVVTIGSATNDIDFSWLGTTTGTFDLDAAAHTLVTTGLDWTITGDIDLTGDLTLTTDDILFASGGVINWADGNVTMTHSTDKLTVAAGWTAGAVGRPFGVELTLSVMGGNYVNALKGYVDASSGGTIGLLSAVNCEIKMPNGACAGAFYPLEVEWVGQTNTAFGLPGTGSSSGFIYMAASGVVTDMDSDGMLMTINGLSTGASNLFSTGTLRISIDDTLYYLPLSTASATFTTAYPIVSTLIGAEAISMGTSGAHLEDTVVGVAVGIYVDNTLTTGSYRALRVETLASGASTTGAHYGIRGTSGLKTAITSSGAAFFVGTQGKIVSAGTGATGATFAGVLGQVNNSGTFNTGSKLYAVWADNQLVTCSGELFMLGLTNTIANKSIDAHMYIYGKAELLIDGWVNQGNWYIAAAKTGDADGGSIKINIDGVDKYIQLWSATS